MAQALRENPPVAPMSPVLSVGTKLENKVDRAIELLKENPSWKKRTLRDLETETGISKNTWAKAKGRVQ